MFRSDTANKATLYVVNQDMTDEERKNLIATWGDRALHDKFEVNPYSLTQEELEALQSYDKLEVKVERLVKDVLVQKALNNSLRYKL